MRRTVILRIAPAALDAGHLAGEAESVATGERVRVTSQEDLLAFIRADDRRNGSPPLLRHPSKEST